MAWTKLYRLVAERFPEVVRLLNGYAAKARADLGDLGRPGAEERPAAMRAPNRLISRAKSNHQRG